MTSRLLYLVRHGEYDDAELADSGREQSRLIGARLREVPFAPIHHSTVPHAAETAELIAAQLPGVPAHRLPAAMRGTDYPVEARI